jgi:phosphotriesterase-related protein
MQVQTVSGPISPNELGISLVHEHLLIDLQCLFAPPRDPQRKHLVDKFVTRDLRDELVSDPYQSKDNLVLSDAKLAARELEYFSLLGGRTVIDLTSRNIGPFPKQLREIANDTGLNIIASTGFYVEKAHPKWIEEAAVEKIEEFMLKEIVEGIDNTDVRAGIIGELGSSVPLHPNELKVMSAAARVQKSTGLAINIHLSIFGREGHNVLTFLESEGASLDRVVLSHVDESRDLDYVRSLAERGVYIELDTFGSEFAFSERGEREPTDWERVDMLVELVEAGLEERILISQDVCNKIHLIEFGGYGYGHILKAIVPRLRKQDIDDSLIEQILIKNPARMLSGESLIGEPTLRKNVSLPA